MFDLCLGNYSKLDIERNKRIIAEVFVKDTFVNLKLVEADLAWHYKQYSSDVRFAKAEEKASANKLGLWALPSPTPPWEWRKSNRKATQAPPK